MDLEGAFHGLMDPLNGLSRAMKTASHENQRFSRFSNPVFSNRSPERIRCTHSVGTDGFEDG